MLKLLICALGVSCIMASSQPGYYLLKIDRANQLIGFYGPKNERIPFLVEKNVDGKVTTEKVYSLPVRTKTVRFIASEGPVIPNDSYGKYCELPPADGKDGMFYKVGPIEDIPEGSKSFGFCTVRLTGPPADKHGRTGLLIHGGGNKLPDPLADYQGWQCSHGCVKMQNIHVKALVQMLRSLPNDADVRLTVGDGKCKINDVVAETYRWDEKTGDWQILSDQSPEAYGIKTSD